MKWGQSRDDSQYNYPLWLIYIGVQTSKGELRIDFENAELAEEIAKDLKDIVSQLQ